MDDATIQGTTTGTAVMEPPGGEGGTASPGTETTEQHPSPGTETTQAEGTEADAAARQKEQEELSELDSLSGDERKLDQRTRAAIAKFRKTDPAAAKIIAQAYFGRDDVIRATGAANFKDAMATIREHAATIDALGGENGIADLQTEVHDYRNEIEQFSKGDAGLLEQLYESSPEGTIASISNGLDIVAARDLKALDNLLLPHMAQRFEDTGFLPSLSKIAEAIKKGDGQDAYDRIVHLGNWADAIIKRGKTLGEGKEKQDPERQALSQQRTELEREKGKVYDDRIGAEVNRLNNTALSKLLEPFFRDVGLKDRDARKDFEGVLLNKVYAAMKADKVFQRNAHAKKGKGDAIGAARFISDKFADLLPTVFEKYRNGAYPNYKKKPAVAATNGNRTTTTQTQQRTAPQKQSQEQRQAADTQARSQLTWVNEKPPREQIDWNRTSETEMISGRAYLTNGKYVRWKVRSDQVMA